MVAMNGTDQAPDHGGHRTLRVVRTQRVTPRMARVTLGGDELTGFPGHGPDQRIKMFFPVAGQDRPAMPRASSGGPVWPPGQARPIIRTYTVRRHDPAAGELDVDFVLHGAHGPAAAWAAGAARGDWVGVSEPGGRYVPDADEHLVIGDESALPAIATVLEALPIEASAEVFIEVADAADEQPLPRPVHWLHRSSRGPGATLVEAIRSAPPPSGARCQAWVSAESSTVRDIRAFLLDECGFSRRQVYATGYWRAR